MRHMNFKKISSIFFLLTLIHCSSHYQNPPGQLCNQANKNDLVFAMIESFKKAQNAEFRSEIIEYTEEGMKWANTCVRSFPKDPQCYYYRAVHTGLYYKQVKLGYQKGLKQMVSDLDQVIKIDPSFDQGGAYRVLGNIYLKAPSFSLSKKSITGDLDKAYEYGKLALEIDSNHLGNRQLWGEILFEKKDYLKSREVLSHLQSDFKKLGLNSLTTYQKKNYQEIIELIKKIDKKI
jgi:tetratricopeptide (TPR) repeat protein